MPRSTGKERTNLANCRRDLRLLVKNSLKNWKASPPSNNNQRDKMLDDHNEALITIVRRLNILEGVADIDDLPNVTEAQVSPPLSPKP